MFRTLNLLFIFLFLNVYSQNTKDDYLKKNSFNLRNQNFSFPEKDFSIIGFGAYHGSSKTYDTELKLVESLQKNNSIEYYIPETNFSQAFFFQKYLDNGDEELLKELVLSFQTIVAQEGTIETFNFWKKLRHLNTKYSNKPIKVIGFDVINQYKFPIKHILLLSQDINHWKTHDELDKIISDNNIDLSLSNENLKSLY